MKKIISIGLATLLSVSLLSTTACGKKNNGRGEGDGELNANYQWANEANYNGTNVLDSSEIADYDGSHEMNLVAWNTTSTGNEKKYETSGDVVSPEIKRITGVSIDNENSFDNKGMTADVRWQNLITTKKIPDIAYGSGWLDTDEVYDLTKYIDKYCPTIKARMPEYVWSSSEVNGGEEGKVYGVPYGLGNVGLSTVDKTADSLKTLMFEFYQDCMPYILVREDILKDAYPDALMQEDIDRIFAEQGYFTKEQLFDINITSSKQFREEFLPKIQKAITDGGDKYRISSDRMVKPMLMTAGSDYDTWDFVGKLIPGFLGAGYNSYNTNFSYWDVTTQKIESMLYQDFFKEEIYEWAKMIADGTIISTEGMTTQHQTLSSELNSGYYAIGYLSSSAPSGNKCNWKGETINYRKVYLNIPFNFERFMYCGDGQAQVSSVKIFKDKVSESELPQLLRWLDYQCSRSADMLYAWGPKTAGLFNEAEDGTRTYKDEDLVDQMVYTTVTMGDKVQKYNLSNGTLKSAVPVFSFYYQAGSKYHPKATYSLANMPGLSNSFYSSAAVLTEMSEKFVGLSSRPSIHTWKNVELDGVETVWSKRPGVESALKQLLISGGSQSSYDKAWNSLQTTLNNSGWTKTYFNGKFTNAFLNSNKAYTYQFYKG